jgi:hypothetical protein
MGDSINSKANGPTQVCIPFMYELANAHSVMHVVWYQYLLVSGTSATILRMYSINIRSKFEVIYDEIL